ncbi:hypothetical protein SIO70_17440 [Chitinophaga sancti]|uniref:hypothetical protein n=1 Tax=Chitinophaga sancti TaxID=1004 RepID=UPI002A7535EC|nr:hypothetical protein [Chitinophaga sancti]WPQ60129.1 hypothetical protein SIO70_17440 [Chitinophaga sancti]
MTAESFVITFKMQVPDRESFNGMGLPEDYIEQELSMYDIKQRNNLLLYSDSLLNLVNDYDLSKIQIGMITFKSELIEDDEYYYIGNIEVDLIVKSKLTGIIQVLEFDNPSHILCDCAVNGDQLLDALLICDSYITKGRFDDEFRENDEIRTAMIEECADKAGGSSYIEFYQMLLG